MRERTVRHAVDRVAWGSTAARRCTGNAPVVRHAVGRRVVEPGVPTHVQVVDA